MINKDGVTCTVDNGLRMLGNYETVERMEKEYGEKIACLSIGPAGEMKLAQRPSPVPTWSFDRPDTQAEGASVPLWAPKGSR